MIGADNTILRNQSIIPTNIPILSMSKPSNGSKVLAKFPLPSDEAKWVELNQILWKDPAGKERLWESAERRTRPKGGIDGKPLKIS